MKVDFFNIEKALFVLGCALLGSITFSSCDETEKYVIYYGSEKSDAEYLACLDLKDYLEKATGEEVLLSDESVEVSASVRVLVGSPQSSSLIRELNDNQSIQLTDVSPGARGGIHQVVTHKGEKLLVLGGSDIQGTQYVVYDYCRDVLKVDPLHEWTGMKIGKLEGFDPYLLQTNVIAPPRVEILSYFENDVDELANLKEPLLQYDMPTYRSLIDALVKMRYNAIQLFDQLGRKEFFQRAAYKKLRPDYQLDLDLVDSLIDYTHQKGMMVQVNLGLGFQMKSVSDEAATCWTNYKKDWVDTWVYLLTETPLAKVDIYSLRPRNQVWDWQYRSTCGEDKATVFNEVYSTMDSLLGVYRPDAIKVAVLYDDGMEIFNEEFEPPKDWIMVWSDDGFSGFKYLPKDTKGYEFGTYMHAGFWRNHTVHDPFPHKIDSVMDMMFDKYGADKYCQVNGQTFRPFMFNLEAFSEVCRDPEAFDPDKFYQNWTSRYFSEELAPIAIRAMKQLHEAHQENRGYVNNLWEIKKLIAYLQDQPVITERTTFDVPFSDAVVSGLPDWNERIFTALATAEEGLKLASADGDFYYDYVYFPVLVYSQLLAFENSLMKAAEFKNAGENDLLLETLKNAQEQLTEIQKTREKGDRNPRWAGWYDLGKRRPNNGFPTQQMIEEALNNAKSL